MDCKQFLIVAAPALGWFLAAASPALVLLFRARYSPGHVAGARRMLPVSAVLAAVFLCDLAGFSFASHNANVIVESLALVFGIGLVAFLFVLRPRVVGILAGVYALLAWLLLLLFMALGVLFDPGDGSESTMADGSVCRKSGYGMVASDSGSNVGVFRRFVFIDKRIATHRYSDISPEGDDLVYSDKTILKQCLTASVAAPVGR